MCILDDLMTLSHSPKTKEYYQSFEDAKNESYSRGTKHGITIGEKRGEKRGRTLGHEEAYMEMMKQLQELNVSKEIMEQLKKPKEITKSKKK